MPAIKMNSANRLSFLFVLGFLLALGSPAAQGQDNPLTRAMQSIVQVNFTTETLGSPESVVEFGKVVKTYQPTIIGLLPATGIVIDDQGHVLTFVGYRWPEIRGRNSKVEIIDAQGQKRSGKLIGIDQNMRVAVILCPGAGLKKTPVCERCEIKNGATVVLPVQEVSKGYQLESAQIISASAGNASGGSGWAIKISRPASIIGAPLLNVQNQVIGIITDQPTRSTSTNPSVDLVDVSILGVSQVISSAGKILAAHGDIQTGWLGVHVNSDVDPRNGVMIDDVEKGSPADKAGLLPNDIITKWNGSAIRDICGQDLMNFIQVIEDTPLGAKAVMNIQRQGKPMILTAVIEARKTQDTSEKLVFDFPSVMALPGARITTGDSQFQSSLGIEIVLLTPQLAESLQMPVSTGLLIASINKQTAFDLAGVLAGDVILGVDGVRTDDPQSFYEHIKARGWGSSLVLRLVRKGAQMTKTVQLPLRKRD
jgi:serine protease Do